EQQYYDALKAISTNFIPSEQIIRRSQQLYGLEAEEAIEMAYDSILAVAKAAVKGKRRPASKSPPFENGGFPVSSKEPPVRQAIYKRLEGHEDEDSSNR